MAAARALVGRSDERRAGTAPPRRIGALGYLHRALARLDAGNGDAGTRDSDGALSGARLRPCYELLRCTVYVGIWRLLHAQEPGTLRCRTAAAGARHRQRMSEWCTRPSPTVHPHARMCKCHEVERLARIRLHRGPTPCAEREREPSKDGDAPLRVRSHAIACEVSTRIWVRCQCRLQHDLLHGLLYIILASLNAAPKSACCLVIESGGDDVPLTLCAAGTGAGTNPRYRRSPALRGDDGIAA